MDKDILIVSLVEFICNQNNNALFDDACSYLQSINLLNPQALSNDTNTKNTRQKYIQYLTTLFNNKVTIVDHINNGGYGNVYKIKHTVDEQIYALKRVPVTNNLSEVKLVAQLNHPNIIRYYTSWLSNEIYDNDSDDEDTLIPYSGSLTKTLNITMELCDYSLRYVLDNAVCVLPNNISVFCNILCGLQYIHDYNIVHCDINPNNILFKNNVVKITDFGLSRYVGEKIIPGTPLYIPDDTYCSCKYDVFSAGIIFYELLNNFNTVMERYDMINKYSVY